jgi:repressor LexA
VGDSIPLTGKQQEILDYIKNYIDSHGFPPAIRDIGKAFDIKSPNGVMCHLRALQKKGYIKREEKNEFQGGIARSITIAGEGRHQSRGGFSLPMLGLVAAGPVLEAQEQDERVDMRDLFGGDNVYMLKVRGESMIDSQIADGDYVVIRKQDQADNGEKVVAMVDRSMTLKKFYRRKDTISLEPCNSTMKPIVVDPSRENVQILGVLVGVIRKCQ